MDDHVCEALANLHSEAHLLEWNQFIDTLANQLERQISILVEALVASILTFIALIVNWLIYESHRAVFVLRLCYY